MLIDGKIVSGKKILENLASDFGISSILVIGKDIPSECIYQDNHQNMSQNFATLVGIINWELVRSGRVEVEDFGQFHKDKGWFGNLMISINQVSGIHSPDDYKKEFDDLHNAKWLTDNMRVMLSELLTKIALHRTLKLVKEV